MDNTDIETMDVVAVAANIERTDELFSFLGEYDFEAEVETLRAALQSSATTMLMIGCRLLRMKEHEAHGRFMDAVEAIGINPRTARRFMNAALRFVHADTGKVKYPQLVQASASKIYELTMLDDDELGTLDSGKSVADITLDDVDKLSVRELRKKIRDSKADIKAHEEQLAAKNQKIDELERELRKYDEAGVLPSFDKEKIERRLNEYNLEITGFLADSNIMATKAITIAEKLCEVSSNSSDPISDGIVRAVFAGLKTNIRTAIEDLERASETIEGMVPKAYMVNAPFTVLNAKDHDGEEI